MKRNPTPKVSDDGASHNGSPHHASPPHENARLRSEVDFENGDSVMRCESPPQTKSRLARLRDFQKHEALAAMSKAFPSVKDDALKEVSRLIADGAKTPFHFDIMVTKGDVKRPVNRFTIPVAVIYREFRPGQSDVVLRGLHRRKAAIPAHYVHRCHLLEVT